MARLFKAEKLKVAARSSKDITTWLDPTHELPNPMQPEPDWDQDPDLLRWKLRMWMVLCVPRRWHAIHRVQDYLTTRGVFMP